MKTPCPNAIDPADAAQLGRYALAGTVNAAVSFAAYAGAVEALGAPFWLANGAALGAGLACGFVLARLFVFRGRGPVRRSAWRYGVTVLGQFALSTALIGLAIAAGAGPLLAYLIVLPAAALLSFVLQRRWVFPAATATRRSPA